MYEVINWLFFVKKIINYVLYKSLRVLVYMYGEKFEEGFLMCMLIIYIMKDYYFGRNFDYEFFYKEVVVVMLKNYLFYFCKVEDIEKYYVFIGIVVVMENYLLYYDVINEKGFSMVGFNFLGNVDYKDFVEGKDNVMLFEFILWIFG